MTKEKEARNATGAERARSLFTSFPYSHPQGRLRERVKELHCLYRVLELTSDKETDAEQICA
ncbi:hypothetical protein, partial [Pseudomonas sp.]|uniref:hypothetical protein n=1 Tax=Pseudomonas sp. TaxID=306 RepID=UPI0025FEAA9B